MHGMEAGCATSMRTRNPDTVGSVFSWDVHLPGDARIGPCGVSGDVGRAQECCADALRTSPAGSVGFVDRVALSRIGDPTYDYRAHVAHGWFAIASDAVVWAK